MAHRNRAVKAPLHKRHKSFSATCQRVKTEFMWTNLLEIDSNSSSHFQTDPLPKSAIVSRCFASAFKDFLFSVGDADRALLLH
jgi:hypothetical protein